MPDEQFKPGDVVMLKSGGPHMTITEIEGDKAWCEWFEGYKSLQGSFKKVALRHSDPN
jgi:uncharacterized protein YodC (DUF2158 family)